ncbi:MAG: chorismate mutase [Verrucomicrobia bacterium]|nr:chorismate mutase [Verrucomicrobiota bacterium]
MRTTVVSLAVLLSFALDIHADTHDQLEAYRQKINSVDRQLVELIQQRAQIVAEIGDLKREAHIPVTDSNREQQVMAKAQELAKDGPMPKDAVGRIYQKLIEEMRNWEATLTASPTPAVSSQPTPSGGSK